MAAEFARMRLFNAARRFAERARPWDECIRYQTMPDERWSLPAVAARVYGDSTMTLVVQAAAGLDSPELELTERMLVLPTPGQLQQMLTDAGWWQQPPAEEVESDAYVVPDPLMREAAPPISGAA